jgi:AraC-like DNA-binding protein
VLYRVWLEKARARLLAADGESPVTIIAKEGGFSHLSRFAGAWARTYGKQPSKAQAHRHD